MDNVTRLLMQSSGGKKDSTYVDDVFSTYVRTYTGATATITNGIDLAGKGGLVWAKNRTQNYNHCHLLQKYKLHMFHRFY